MESTVPDIGLQEWLKPRRIPVTVMQEQNNVFAGIILELSLNVNINMLFIYVGCVCN